MKKLITSLLFAILLVGITANATNLYLIANNGTTWTSTPTGFDNIYKVDLSNSGSNGTTAVSLTQWLNDRNAATPTYLINGVAGSTFSTSDQVWIAGGTYNVAIAWTVLSAAGTPTPGNVYGGFMGNENAVTERIKGTNAWNFTSETIINSSTSTTGAIAAGGDRTITFDGLTFNGFGTTQTIQQRGNLNIQNCKFTSNTACSINFYNGTKNASVTNCYFYSNSYPSGSNSACITINTSTAAVVYTVSGCLFEANTNASTSAGTSAGIKTSGSGTYNISNCVFKNNKASGGASSAVSFTVATSNLTNCLIYGNVSDAGTLPGLYMTSGTVTNCSFLNTYKGVYINSNAATSLTNCVFWGTLASSGQINSGGTTANINLNNCAYISVGAVNANNNPVVLPATNDLGTNAPNFKDPSTNDWTLLPTSSLLNTGTATGAPATDITGFSRPQGGGFDIGAYELPYYTTTLTYNSEGGAVTPSTVTALAAGSQQSFVITPASGYQLATVLYNNVDGTSQLTNLLDGQNTYNGGTYTISSLSGNFALAVTFTLSTTTSVNDQKSAIRCISHNGVVEINGLESGNDVMVYTVTGNRIISQKASSSNLTFTLPNGAYIVRSGSRCDKVLVNK